MRTIGRGPVERRRRTGGEGGGGAARSAQTREIDDLNGHLLRLERRLRGGLRSAAAAVLLRRRLRGCVVAETRAPIESAARSSARGAHNTNMKTHKRASLYSSNLYRVGINEEAKHKVISVGMDRSNTAIRICCTADSAKM